MKRCEQHVIDPQPATHFVRIWTRDPKVATPFDYLVCADHARGLITQAKIEHMPYAQCVLPTEPDTKTNPAEALLAYVDAIHASDVPKVS